MGWSGREWLSNYLGEGRSVGCHQEEDIITTSQGNSHFPDRLFSVAISQFSPNSSSFSWFPPATIFSFYLVTSLSQSSRIIAYAFLFFGSLAIFFHLSAQILNPFSKEGEPSNTNKEPCVNKQTMSWLLLEEDYGNWDKYLHFDEIRDKHGLRCIENWFWFSRNRSFSSG